MRAHGVTVLAMDELRGEPGTSRYFPTVGVVGNSPYVAMMESAATPLGISLATLEINPVDSARLKRVHDFAGKCSVVWCEEAEMTESLVTSLRAEGVAIFPSPHMYHNRRALTLSGRQAQFSVTVARTPHNQATTWAPTELIYRAGALMYTITPAPSLSADLKIKAQALALSCAASVDLIGVMSMSFDVSEPNILIRNLHFGPQFDGVWTVEGAITSQFEQHLRALLDLPLGVTTLVAPHTVVGTFYRGEKKDMYRPYLHLMARSPALKFYHYRGPLHQGEIAGHLSISGGTVEILMHEIHHGIAYMSGEIEE